MKKSTEEGAFFLSLLFSFQDSFMMTIKS